MASGNETRDLFDENGFLLDPGQWNRDLAQSIALDLGLGDLNADHWGVIYFIRAHYLACGSLPWPPHVCRELELGQRCVRRLFGGPLEAWKVAGLPDPGEEARTYMENEEP